MKTALTSQQVELYQREGWLILEDFLTSDELQEMCFAVSETVTQMRSNRIADGGKSNKALFQEVKPFNQRVFLQRVNLWKINDAVKRHFLNPELALTASGCGTIRHYRNSPGTTPHPGTWMIPIGHFTLLTPSPFGLPWTMRRFRIVACIICPAHTR